MVAGRRVGQEFHFLWETVPWFCVFLEFPDDLAGCVHVEAHTALSTAGEVPVTELPLLPEVKVSAMETALLCRIARS